ncbi:Uncharacterised protein [Bacteroides heparinolyticus]|uniref:Uncharacterized protein n=1 Tax=Prevotella heparinolytica TaxID=28113 RepID=A0A449I555_9BACE|nr:Uncharacterised protein [Bacteroides heparinolyticus]
MLAFLIQSYQEHAKTASGSYPLRHKSTFTRGAGTEQRDVSAEEVLFRTAVSFLIEVGQFLDVALDTVYH